MVNNNSNNNNNNDNNQVVNSNDNSNTWIGLVSGIVGLALLVFALYRAFKCSRSNKFLHVLGAFVLTKLWFLLWPQA